MKKNIIQKKPFGLFLALAILIAFSACHKITVGYLITEDAGYEIDSIVIKSVLDITPPVVTPNPLYDMYLGFGFPPDFIIEIGIYPTIESGGGEDYARNKLGQPWTSTPIEGVLGTPPIVATIKDITSGTGDPEKLKRVITVRSNGILTIPLDHQVPPGIYYISVTFKNEGYSKDINNAFTVIVK